MRGITDVLTQVSTFQLVRNSREQYEYCDLLIHPDVEEYSMTDFDDVKSIAALGRDSALRHMDTVRDL